MNPNPTHPQSPHLLTRRWFLRSLLLSPLTIPSLLRAHTHPPKTTTPEAVTLWNPDAPRIETPPYLIEWKRAPRIPVLESDNPHLQIVLEAIQRREWLYFEYQQRSKDLPIRQIKPHFLFHVGDPYHAYLSGWDHTRQDERTFLCSRMGLLLTAPWMFPMFQLDPYTGSQRMQQTSRFIQTRITPPKALASA